MNFTVAISENHCTKGIISAKILERVAISSSRRSSQPRYQSQVSCGLALTSVFFTAEPPEKPWVLVKWEPKNMEQDINSSCYRHLCELIGVQGDLHHSVNSLWVCDWLVIGYSGKRQYSALGLSMDSRPKSSLILLAGLTWSSCLTSQYLFSHLYIMRMVIIKPTSGMLVSSWNELI